MLAVETLLNIVRSQRLRASGKLLRAGASGRFLHRRARCRADKRRRYQAHLGRWDWEPYGC